MCMAGGNAFKCNFCKVCNGKGCIGQLPGMGGVHQNENFILNCAAWEIVRNKNIEKIQKFLELEPEFRLPSISIAPMTGAVENIGFEREADFYDAIIQAMHKVGVGLCIGDGYPDEKLKFGIKALKKIKIETPDASTSVFIKPYSNEKILERFEWAKDCVKVTGIDIDSYNILTMRNKVQLEKKSAEQLIQIKKHVKMPFAIKGIFTKEDIKLVKEVMPDIAYISNHGGRIDTRKGSTAEFLAKYGDELKKYCGELWIDGGIRSPKDVATAMALGADCVLVGRPFASALCHGGAEELCGKVLELSLLKYGF
ncbi:alpha-hydroxy-acid oxidizing protein [Treponema sp. UBA3813]|uniref:alpha-hydroxy-acid oxidizing protein n=1 Tax=Treponema sp. UBA3813 TaxID=1947715 RepID=UPI0032E43A64